MIKDFLADTDFHNADAQQFSADWSVRSYQRLKNDKGESAILLISPPDDSPKAMVGSMLGEWVRMNHHFHALGVNVPNILKQDLDNGLILMSDFGDETIAGKGVEAYLKAIDILIQMRDHENALNIELIKYEDSHVYKALRFYPQYISGSGEEEWFATWREIENSLPPCPRALTHMDFAPMNLMWVNGDIGVIDFQAACNGPFVYDIVNLLEDIRIDVPRNIKDACIERYKEGLNHSYKNAFDQWYSVITAQFHARILGQIQFLSKEKGRNDLTQYYDSTQTRFEKIIELPLLRPIKTLLKSYD